MMENSAALWQKWLVEIEDRVSQDELALLRGCETEFNEEGRLVIWVVDRKVGDLVKSWLIKSMSTWTKIFNCAVDIQRVEKQGGDFHNTDVGNAQRLAKKYGEQARYCFPWRSWLVWDGTRWAKDESGRICQLAKDVVKGMYAEAAGLEDEGERKALANHARHSEHVNRMRAMCSLAESELPVHPSELDVNDWVLNVRNGTIDLKTGALQPHNKENFVTKLASVGYDPDAECPRWLQFLDEIMDGNQGMIDFLQRAIGYSLTGDTREQCFFILWGSGANGKSTLLNVVREIIGDYATQTATSTLLAKKYDGSSNDLARLHNVRFVSASETEAGRKLASGLVKVLTGGDPVVARFLYQEHFTFVPRFKLWLGVNSLPVITESDYAIWRRIRLVPFRVQIPPEKQDLTLPDKLREERPGILRWAIEGCLRWQKEGLAPPVEVTVETAAYRHEMDTFQQFLDDCFDLGGEKRASNRELYGAYTEWCMANGERALSKQGLSSEFKRRGFEAFNSSGVRGYLGMAVRQTVPLAED